MQHLGLNGDVSAGGHRFHVQTTYSASKEMIVSHVFEQGRIIDRCELSCASATPPELIAQKLQAFHLDTTAEMKLLFQISEKVRRAKHPPSCLRLGAVFLEKNLPDEALAVLQLALELAPHLPEVPQGLGRVFLRQKEFAAAEEMFRRGLQLAPEYADLHHDLGAALLEQNRLLAALPEFETALRINPKFPLAHASLALTLLLTLQGSQPLQDHLPPPPARLKRAQDLLHGLRQLLPASKHHAHVIAASAALARKDYTEAIAELQSLGAQMLAAPELIFESDFYLKFMFGGKSRDDQFIQRYAERLRAAISDYPAYADWHNHLGVAHLIQSRNLFLRAIEEFREAVKINPDYKRAGKNLKLSENDSKSFVYLLRAMLK